MPTEYDAFISYSHVADGKLAPAVQRGLSRLAKTWSQRQALRVFRDDTGLGVSPHLWGSIVVALDNARFFVLLASPDAAASEWVNKEVEHWRAVHGVETILPVLTDGTWDWDDAAQDFTVDSTAVPLALRGAFTEEPRHLDLHWAREEAHLSLHNARFRNAIAELAAPMRGVAKEDLESEDLHQQRKTLRLARGAVALLALLTVGALVGAGFAVVDARRADKERRAAVARELAATSGNIAGENLPAALVLAAAAQQTDVGSAGRRALVRAARADPQLERSIRRGGYVFPAGDGSAFVIADGTERDRFTVYGPGGRRRQVVPAPGVGRVSDVQWVQAAGPAARPTGLVVRGSKGLAYARVEEAPRKLSDASLLSKAWPKAPIETSPDGAGVAVVAGPRKVRLFAFGPGVDDVRDVYTGTLSDTHDPGSRPALYSENGSFAVLSMPDGLTVLDARTGDVVSEWESGGRYMLSDDGTLTLASDTGLVTVPPGTLSEAGSGSATAIRTPRSIPLAGLSLDALSHDSSLTARSGGNEVALATADEVMLADVVTGRLLWRLPEPDATANTTVTQRVFFVPGTSLLLDNSRAGVTLRDVATGAVVWELPGASEVTLGPSGRFDVVENTGPDHDSVAIVDLATMQVLGQERAFVSAAVWSQDETAVVTFANQPRLWKLTPAGVTVSRAGLEGAPVNDDLGTGQAVFLAGGKRLITSARGRATVWRFESPGALVGARRTYDERFKDRDPASGVLAEDDPERENTVLFSGPDGRRLGRYRAPGYPTNVTILGDGRRALVGATADDTTSLAVVDVTKGRAISKRRTVCGFDDFGELVPSQSGRWFIGLSPSPPATDGSRSVVSLIACNPESGTTRRLRVRGGVLSTAGTPGWLDPNDVAISDDGRWAVFTTESYDTRLQELGHPRGATRHVKLDGVSPQVAITSDGRRAWVVDGGTLRILDRDDPTPDLITVPLDEKVSVPSLAIDAGQHLAALELSVGGSYDEEHRTEVVTVLVDLDEGSVLGTISDEQAAPTGRLGFSKDGSKLTSIAFVPDLSYKVQTWDVGKRVLLRRACERSGGNLTQSEWKAVAPNADYVAPCHQ